MSQALERRASPEVRRRQILEAGIEIVKRDAFYNVTIKGVAYRVGISERTVRHYYANRLTLLGAVARYAVQHYPGDLARRAQRYL